MDVDALASLWAKEQELIKVINQIREKATTEEGKRQTMMLVDQNGRLSVQPNNPPPSPEPRARSAIILPGSFSGTASFSVNQTCVPNVPLLGQNDLDGLFGDNALFAGLGEPPKPIQARSSAPKLNVPEELREKAYNLTQEIARLRSAAGLNPPMCNTVSARDINIREGGDGTYKTSDGAILPIPSTPLGKTCTGKSSSLGLGISECVLCPVNYIEIDKRYEDWLKLMQNKSKEETSDRGKSNE